MPQMGADQYSMHWLHMATKTNILYVARLNWAMGSKYKYTLDFEGLIWKK